MNNFFDNQRILEIIWSRKFHFILIGVVAIVLSAVFSGPSFITPKFKSTARVYPANAWVMSEESETEQMLEIMNSNDIKLKMFDAFNLSEVYEVDEEDPLYLTYMFSMYNENVSLSKTNYETVEIEVFDVLPQRASDMCDSIIHFYDRKVRDLYKSKDLEMVGNLERMLNQKSTELDSVRSDLNELRGAYEIIDFEEQVPEVTRGYMNALANGRVSTSEGEKIREIYNNLAEKGTEALWLESRHDYLISTIDSLTSAHDFYLSEYQKNITYSYVVESPVPGDKKAYPVRWLIVAVTTSSAIFLALLVFLVLDYRKK